MNDVNFNLGSGGLGVQPAAQDYISGLLLVQVQPGSWGTEKIRSFRSIKQVEAAGIEAFDPTFGLVHYTCAEFFRMNPTGLLYLIFDTVDPSIIVAKTAGSIRQFAAFDTIDTVSDYNTLMEQLRALHAPAICLIGAEDITDIKNATQVPDLHIKDSQYISVIVAGDNSGAGKALAVALGVNYIPAIGTVLGAVSASAVSDSAAWVEKFNFAVADGELDKLIFAGGEAYETLLDADLEDLNDKGYLFFRKFVGYAGSFLNETFTAVDEESDYLKIERNRTVQKAERLLYAVLLPKLNSPVLVDPITGKLAIETVKYFQGICEKTLRENMLNKAELSGFEVSIDPNQNVLSTSTLAVEVELVPVGTANTIAVGLGFALKVGN